MESHKLSVKRILIDLLSIKDQLKRLFNDNIKYATLINFLTEKDYCKDDDIPLSGLKEIESKTGLKTNQLRNQILKIYQELFEYDSNKTLEFNNKEYFSFLNFNNSYNLFDILPRKYKKIWEDMKNQIIGMTSSCMLLALLEVHTTKQIRSEMAEARALLQPKFIGCISESF